MRVSYSDNEGLHTVGERLCEEVRKYPHLYNCSMKEYKDIYMGYNSWIEIVQTLASLGQERYCNLVQRACVEHLCTRLVTYQSLFKKSPKKSDNCGMNVVSFAQIGVYKAYFSWPLTSCSDMLSLQNSDWLFHSEGRASCDWAAMLSVAFFPIQNNTSDMSWVFYSLCAYTSNEVYFAKLCVWLYT